MKFIPCQDDDELFHRVESENHLIEMGVYRVIFGYRIRAGFVRDEGYYILDWCAGQNWKDVERLYSLCFAVLSKREENSHCFDGLPPFSRIKPFYLDKDFVRIVGEKAGVIDDDFELISLKEPPWFDLALFEKRK